MCLRMDNTTAVAYLNHMGGTQSQTLAAYAKQLWLWCLNRGITLSAEYLPGEMNITADFQSRTPNGSAEWRLDPSVFQAILQILGPCTVDLRLNTQLEQYISWRPEPFAIATDALQVPWINLQGYAFPPFCLIGKCLRKAEREQATVLLIAPVWPHQTWYPALLETLIDTPILLPRLHDLGHRPIRPATPTGQLPAIGRMGGVRERLASSGISGQAAQLITAGWSKGTSSTYQSAWAKWQCWCMKRDLDPFSCNVSSFVNFLALLFNQGLQHRTINTVRSAVSVTHDQVEGAPIG